MRSFLFPLLLAMSLSGCTLVVHEKIDDLYVNAVPDMTFEISNFVPHVGSLVEFFLVNDSNLVQARATYDPLPGTGVTVQLQDVIEPTVRNLRFYADINDNRIIDPPSGTGTFIDHMWVFTLSDRGSGSFPHNTNFTNILVAPNDFVISLAPLRYTITDATALADQPVEIQVVDTSADEVFRQVGYYFLGRVPGGTIDITMDGIIDDGTQYTVRLIDETGATHCTTAVGTPTGLAITLSFSSLVDC